MLSADTNLFLYAANPDCPQHAAASGFFREHSSAGSGFVLCELVLIEIYMQLRNPAILRTPLSAPAAADFCGRLRANPEWQLVDYEPAVSQRLWRWARSTPSAFRRIIDARLALTLQHHGVTEFATANVRDFEEFEFERLWNPIVG
jgi:toxin-antitoxin system PIN domain toxin